jgi:argininosuccinate lyase
MRRRRVDIRGRRLKKFNDRATEFISSVDFDAPIAGHVLKINTAHILSLVKSGEVTKEIGVQCLKFLTKEPTSLRSFPGAEDIHQVIEQRAVDRLGVEAAGFLNLGKSRNDQVATAVRMELRRRIVALLKSLSSLQDSIVGLVRRYGRTIIPGYTHLQHAQPITIGHHFMAHFDALQRDTDRLIQLYTRVNQSSMGGAALAGTSVAIDRRGVASLLGFHGYVENAMDAVSSRDFVVEALACAEKTMLNLTRLAEELILWSTKEFGFAEVSDEYAASSSIMPQKKNPVVAEIIRAKCGSVLGCLQAVCTIIKGLPYSYNLDLQEITPNLWRGLRYTEDSIEMMSGMVATLRFNVHAVQSSLKDDFSTATSLADYLVKANGVSFRQAHAMVGQLVRISVERGVPFQTTVLNDLPHASHDLIGKTIKVEPSILREVLDPAGALSTILSEGGSNPRFLQDAVEKRRAQIKKNVSVISEVERNLKEADQALVRSVNSVLKGVRR